MALSTYVGGRLRFAVAACALLAMGPGGPALLGVDFIRGDANGDGRVSTADSHMISSYLFRTGETFPCADAADVDDNGSVQLADAVKLFHYLILGEDRPPAPYPDPGQDVTEDEDHLSCEEYGTGSRLEDPASAFRVVDATVEGGANRHATIRLSISNSTRLAGYFAEVETGGLFVDKDLTENDWSDGIVDLTGTLQAGMLLARSNAAAGLVQAEFISSILGNVGIPPRAEQGVLDMHLCLRPGTPAGTYPLQLRTAELVDFDSYRGIDPVLVSGQITVLEDVVDAGCVIPPSDPWDHRFTHVMFRLEEAAGVPGMEVEVPFVIQASDHAVAKGVKLSIDFDETALELLEVRPILERPDGTPWPPSNPFIDNENATPGNAGCDEGYLAGTFLYARDAERDLHFPVNQEFVALSLRFRIRQGAPSGTTELRFIERVPNLPSRETRCESHGTSLLAGGIDLTPGLVDSFILVSGVVNIIGEVTTFLRGDANGDREVNLSDAVFDLNYLFASGDRPGCLDAADANDDGAVNLTDAVSILGSLFLAREALPPPQGQPGVDPTDDDGLTCVDGTR